MELTGKHVVVVGLGVVGIPILLVNLGGSAVLSIRFLLERGSFQSLEKWQTGYVPVYAAWGVVVVIGFPLVFRMVG